MKKHIFTIVISLFVIMFGFLLTITEIIDFKFVNTFNSEVVSISEKSYQFDITSPSVIIDSRNLNEVDIEYDEDIQVGTIKIKATYYDDFVIIEKIDSIENNSDLISIVTEGVSNKRAIKKYIDLTIEGLKEKEIYNYYQALKPNLKIMINNEDADIVKIRR
ncbi:MAG: hypothetical protein PHT75_02890 [Bacilli bacterium]|nr:hypothetical protein [Bacilli bacterium]MDD3305053.1 hypothetical protein [Bacilli bacterium]MDD4053478.1 hypothetical protein [Bacilli bacterium]MDD4411513.1 hypothetical protein [Bacilli bacterium]